MKRYLFARYGTLDNIKTVNLTIESITLRPRQYNNFNNETEIHRFQSSCFYSLSLYLSLSP